MTLNEALNIKNDKRTKLLEEADAKRRELHARFPEIRIIDKNIEALPFRLMGGESKEKLSAEAERLNSERERILASAGYPKDYDEPKFECLDCNDSGYTDGLKLCHCIKEMAAAQRYSQSSLAGGLIGKTFDNFSLDFYNRQNGERMQMEEILNGCKRYANDFPNDSSAGLLFIGGTGLGKTHLSAAVANQVASKGYSVIYESAQQIFDTCDAVRFNRMDISERTKYENCSLLIIDDLGAECITQYSVSAITSLIDLRIVNGRPTIISTNLNHASIRKTYGERLSSRLMGEFRVRQFAGKDIRMQKIKGE